MSIHCDVAQNRPSPPVYPQVQLQNMMTSKYIGFFLKEISAWQKTLGVVDTVLRNVHLPHLSVIITVIVVIIMITACEQVIVLWMEVQRTWSYLESIFIGSEDIRKQLPEDSDRRDIVFFFKNSPSCGR